MEGGAGGPLENKIPVVVNRLHSSSRFLTAVGCLRCVSVVSVLHKYWTDFFEVTAPRRCRLPFLLRTKATPATVTRFGVVLALLGSSMNGKPVLNDNEILWETHT